MRSLLFILATALAFAGTAQESSLQIKVLDYYSYSPIQSASIQIGNNQDSLLYADLLGEFNLELEQEVDLRIRAEGYQDQLLSFGDLVDENIVYLLPISLVVPRVSQIPVAIVGTEESRNEPFLQSVIPPLRPLELKQDDESSLMFALNAVPGVRFESRGYGGSRRINLRGSTLRSPFAVRNIPMYIDQIPITGPDGQAWLEILDGWDLSSLEVIQGTAAHRYGSGTGGALLASTHELNSGTPNRITTRQSVGSYNFYRSASTVSVGSDDISLRLSHIFQETQGYRLQEYNRKQQVSLKLRYVASNRLDYFLFAMQYDGRWGLPGGLSLDGVNEDPQQASQFSIDNNAHVDRFRVLGGITQRWTSRKHQNLTTVFANSTDKINPFGTSPFFNGYKDESASGGGIRTQSQFKLIEKDSLRFNAEVSAQIFNDVNYLDESTNDLGGPGTAKYVNETESNEALLNAHFDLTLFKDLQIEGGATFNYRQIDSRNGLPDSSAFDYTFVNRDFSNLSYTAGMRYRIEPETYIYGQISSAFSPPSNFELLDPEDGVLSQTLEAEQALQIEAGATTTAMDWLNIELRAYRMDLTDNIRPQTDSLGITRFVNFGSALLEGAEVRIWNAFQFERGPIAHVSYSGSAVLQQYTQNQIGDEEKSFAMTGVPLATAAGNLQVASRIGVILDVQYRWTDSTPLTDENTVWMAANDVLNSKLTFRSNLKTDFWSFELFGGCQNLLDEQYTTFAVYNAFGGRFYNPMPGRTFFGGFQLSCNF